MFYFFQKKQLYWCVIFDKNPFHYSKHLCLQQSES